MVTWKEIFNSMSSESQKFFKDYENSEMLEYKNVDAESLSIKLKTDDYIHTIFCTISSR